MWGDEAGPDGDAVAAGAATASPPPSSRPGSVGAAGSSGEPAPANEAPLAADEIAYGFPDGGDAGVTGGAALAPAPEAPVAGDAGGPGRAEGDEGPAVLGAPAVERATEHNRVRVPFYMVIAATLIKHMLVATALLALTATGLYVTAVAMPDVARLPMAPISTTAAAATNADGGGGGSPPVDAADSMVKYSSLGVFSACERLADGSEDCGGFSSALCDQIAEHSTGSDFCSVRHTVGMFMIIAACANAVVVVSILSLFQPNGQQTVCCPTKHVGPSIFLGLMISGTAGLIAMSLTTSSIRSYESPQGPIVDGSGFVMLATAWPLTGLNLVLAFCTATLIFILGQVYNHMQHQQHQQRDMLQVQQSGHRLPLEPYVLRMICHSEGVWGAEGTDPISLEQFEFGVGCMLPPCGHPMLKPSLDALFDGTDAACMKPCPMCRVPMTKAAFAEITERQAPPPREPEKAAEKTDRAELEAGGAPAPGAGGADAASAILGMDTRFLNL